jgi:hypothetical protein
MPEGEKYLNPIMRIDSYHLIEKAKISLEKAGTFSIIWLFDDFDFGTVKELFELDADFVRAHCQACNGHFFIFKSKDMEIEKDQKGMCISCGILMTLMVMLKADDDRIKKWMISKGEINPLEILKDATQIFIP